MKKDDYLILGAMGVLALFIWLRDLSWMTAAEDTVPILVALPLFAWMAAPWRFEEEAESPPIIWVAVSTLLFLLGIVANMALLLAVAWTLLLWSWIKVRVKKEDHARISKLLVLPIMAFPWVALDAEVIGWFFRLTGAFTVASVFTMLGFEVEQEGTFILINGLSISVELACAGLNTLQSMLIAGSIVAYMYLGNRPRYWINIPLIFVLAWIANTLRIFVITITGILISPDFAIGAFHTWGGWFVLVVMFALSWGLFSIQEQEDLGSQGVSS